MKTHFVLAQLGLLVVAGTPALAQTETEFRNLLRQHCVQCHGPEKQSGDVRFDMLPLTDLGSDQFTIWKTALGRVRDGEMPPKKKLTQTQTNAFKSFLEPTLSREVAGIDRSQTVLRRLNQEQYRNSVRDLFGIDVIVKDPAAGLPPDEVVDDLDNIGSALSMSPIHMDAYMEAAEKVVSAWQRRADAAEAAESFQFHAIAGADGNFNGVHQTDEYADLFNSAWTNRRFKAMEFKSKTGLLPQPGLYRITVDVEAVHTDNPAGYELLKQSKIPYQPDPSQTPQLGFYLRRTSRDVSPNIDLNVATFEIPHGQRRTVTTETYLPDGLYTLVALFDTGPRYDLAVAAGVFSAIKEREDDGKNLSNEQRKALDKRIGELTNRVRKDKAYAEEAIGYLASLPLPRLRIYSIRIEGPLADPEAPQPDLIQSLHKDPKRLREELSEFLSRAFRRPVTEAELGAYANYAATHGYRGAVKAALCSPAFLYMQESPDELSHEALASRLSYFLWNSLPDENLRKAAASGSLSSSATMRGQVDRLLKDAKSQSFEDRFVWQWLGLETLHDMPPDGSHDYYHDYFVADLMAKESRLFFHDMLEHNRPIGTFFQADYTFMNAALARHYGRKGVIGSEFKKVSLADEPTRRGLLGQGAVLAASANGVDTSPVLRGIWVLDRLFGTPPAPPPDDVAVIEPDTRGTKSLREMYAAHRTNQSCNRCHQAIDPLGFALENFDPVGLWRDQYDGGLKIESYGELPSGEKFDDVQSFYQLLADENVDLLARNLLTRLLTCATGRRLDAADDAEIDQILKKLKPSGYPFRELLHAVVQSEAFHTK